MSDKTKVLPEFSDYQPPPERRAPRAPQEPTVEAEPEKTMALSLDQMPPVGGGPMPPVGGGYVPPEGDESTMMIDAATAARLTQEPVRPAAQIDPQEARTELIDFDAMPAHMKSQLQQGMRQARAAQPHANPYAGGTRQTTAAASSASGALVAVAAVGALLLGLLSVFELLVYAEIVPGLPFLPFGIPSVAGSFIAGSVAYLLIAIGYLGGKSRLGGLATPIGALAALITLGMLFFLFGHESLGADAGSIVTVLLLMPGVLWAMLGAWSFSAASKLGGLAFAIGIPALIGGAASTLFWALAIGRVADPDLMEILHIAHLVGLGLLGAAGILLCAGLMGPARRNS